MSQTIHLQVPEAGRDDPRKLNLFPGRALSEREFELLQSYVDDRIAPLAGLLPAGIVSGLELRVTGGGGDTRLRFLPGGAVGGGGQLLRLFYPLEQDWTSLADQAERDHDAPLADGIYFITLRVTVEAIDSPDNRPPCSRSETDPLRDRRLETVVMPGLQRVSGNPRLLAMAQAEIGNRVCVDYLARSPFDAASGAVPVALVKVVDRIPEWIDTVAGRYMAEEDAPYRTLLAHSVSVWQDFIQQDARLSLDASKGRQPLAKLLGIPYLPAAGPFPQSLLQDPAGNPPRLAFAPRDLGVDLVPVPASTVQGVIEDELPRGTVDLIHNRGDRIRLLLAIPDLDFRHDLLDRPLRDLALEAQLFARYNTAAKSWGDWRSQWQLIYGQLPAETLTQLQAPPLIPPPATPDDVRDQLVAARRRALPDETVPLPEPWISHIHAPYEGDAVPPAADTTTDGLFQQRATLQAQIRSLEADLDESFQLLNEVSDYLGLQRQQLDALTVSFGALAGGVAGDGAGLKLMRWSLSAALAPELGATTSSTGGQ